MGICPPAGCGRQRELKISVANAVVPDLYRDCEMHICQPMNIRVGSF